MVRQFRYAADDPGPLRDNRRHGFAARFALTAYGTGTVVSLIPKNGCSTLRYALGRANGVIRSADDADWIHRNTHTFQASLGELIRAPHTLVVLRCPFRRLASAFLDKIVGQAPPFDRLYGPRGTAPEHITFRSFVDLVCGSTKGTADIHWKPQVDFLVYTHYDQWVCLEDFTATWPALERHLGVAITDTRMIFGHGRDQVVTVEDAAGPDTPLPKLQALRAAGQGPSYRSLYDTPIADRVALRYAGDLALYADRFGVAGLLFPGHAQARIAPKAAQSGATPTHAPKVAQTFAHQEGTP